jgi:hypothetical protein
MCENDIKMDLRTILWKCELNWSAIIFNGGFWQEDYTPLFSVRRGVYGIDEILLFKFWFDLFNMLNN